MALDICKFPLTNYGAGQSQIAACILIVCILKADRKRYRYLKFFVPYILSWVLCSPLTLRQFNFFDKQFFAWHVFLLIFFSFFFRFVYFFSFSFISVFSVFGLFLMRRFEKKTHFYFVHQSKKIQICFLFLLKINTHTHTIFTHLSTIKQNVLICALASLSLTRAVRSAIIFPRFPHQL